jgi:ribosomal protein S3
MGQKTHPKAFRLVTTQNHLSNWYSNKILYPIYSREDFFIRKEIHKSFKDILHLAEIQINREIHGLTTNNVNITIKALKPKTDEIQKMIFDKKEEFSLIKEKKLNLNTKGIKFLNEIKDKQFKTFKKKVLFEYGKKIQRKFFDVFNQEEINDLLLKYTTTEIRKLVSIYNKKDTHYILRTYKKYEIKRILRTFQRKEIKSFLFPKIRFIYYHKKTAIYFILKEKIHSLFIYLRKINKRNYTLKIVFVNSAYQHAAILVRFIALQLEKRVVYRRVLKLILREIKRDSKIIKGIKIQLSGRLNGAEMARSEWLRKGKIPLHTLQATVDYAQDIAKTSDGIIGIKVWLNKIIK